MLGVTKFARGTGNVGLREWPEPAVGPGQVLIAVRAAGICGTDLHVYDDTYLNRPPVIMGHEGAGVVVQAGPGVKEWAGGGAGAGRRADGRLARGNGGRAG